MEIKLSSNSILKMDSAIDEAVKQCMERAKRSSGDYKYTTKLRLKHGL